MRVEPSCDGGQGPAVDGACASLWTASICCIHAIQCAMQNDRSAVSRGLAGLLHCSSQGLRPVAHTRLIYDTDGHGPQGSAAAGPPGLPGLGQDKERCPCCCGHCGAERQGTSGLSSLQAASQSAGSVWHLADRLACAEVVTAGRRGMHRPQSQARGRSDAPRQVGDGIAA